MNRQPVSHPATQGEEANLRRLDWRFLLPTPKNGSAGDSFRHLLLLGGTKALANRIIEAKIAEQVSCDLVNGQFAHSQRADAAILLHNSTIKLEEAAACLEQGGVLYQEISRKGLSWLRTSPTQLRQRLKRTGLTLTGLYWAAPNFERCRRYIPLDVPGALQWYFSSLFVAGTPFHQLIRTLMPRIIGTHSERFGRFVPSLSVTAVAGSDFHRPPSLLYHPNIVSILQQDNLRPMIMTSGQDDASRLIMLPFAPQGRRPEAVIKIATKPNFNAETEIEQTVLQEVRTRLDTKTRAGIPEPLGVFHVRDWAVSMERCAFGKSLWVSSGEWGASPQRKIADAQLGARWLTTFHQQTASTRVPWNQQAIERWIETPLAAYAQARPLSEGEQRLFAHMRAHANKLADASLPVELPLVWQHHDFAPWNLFRDGEQLTVIDWEFNRDWESTRAGPALCDLLYFFTYWNNVAHQLYSQEAELEGIRTLFLDAQPRSQTIGAARQAIATYMSALRIDWRFLPLLLVHLWTERVVYSYGRTHKLTGRAGPSRAADKFAKYVGLLADHAEALFAVEGDGFWQGQMGSTAKIANESPLSELVA